MEACAVNKMWLLHYKMWLHSFFVHQHFGSPCGTHSTLPARPAQPAIPAPPSPPPLQGQAAPALPAARRQGVRRLRVCTEWPPREGRKTLHTGLCVGNRMTVVGRLT